MSVPTIGQMLTVIGTALVAVIALSAGVAALSDWLTRRTATALNNTPALTQRVPAQVQVTVPGQRATAELSSAPHHQAA